MKRIALIACIIITSLIGAAFSLFYYFKLPPFESPVPFDHLQILHKAGEPENTLKAIIASHDKGGKSG